MTLPLRSIRKISLVVPAYNEEEAIGSVVTGFRDELEAGGIPYEIIVVDNNSTDKTGEVALENGARVVSEPGQGYGFACSTGLREASGDAIVLTEGDNTFEPHDIWKILAYLDEPDIDIVLGTRTTKELVERGAKMTWFLHWGNLMLAKSIQVQFWGRCRLTDVGCTFRGIKNPAFHKIAASLREGGPSFSPVMIIWSLKMGLRTVEVPVRYRNRIGQSKITADTSKSIRVGLKMLRLIVSQRFWKRIDT